MCLLNLTLPWNTDPEQGKHAEAAITCHCCGYALKNAVIMVNITEYLFTDLGGTN